MGFKGVGLPISLQKKEGIYEYMYVSVLIINYLENKNGHGWVQLRWTVSKWGRGLVG